MKDHPLVLEPCGEARYTWDAGNATDGPTLAIDADDQHEFLETLRALPALIHGNEDAPALIRDKQLRIAAVLDILVLKKLCESRRDELRAILAARIGKEQADQYVDQLTVTAASSDASSEGRGGRDLFRPLARFSARLSNAPRVLNG